jgi:hypothetical protein
MKVIDQCHGPTAFRLRKISGTNSIGGSVRPSASLSISGKRKIYLLYWDLNTVLQNNWSCASSSHFHSCKLTEGSRTVLRVVLFFFV